MLAGVEQVAVDRIFYFQKTRPTLIRKLASVARRSSQSGENKKRARELYFSPLARSFIAFPDWNAKLRWLYESLKALSLEGPKALFSHFLSCFFYSLATTLKLFRSKLVPHKGSKDLWQGSRFKPWKVDLLSVIVARPQGVTRMRYFANFCGAEKSCN